MTLKFLSFGEATDELNLNLVGVKCAGLKDSLDLNEVLVPCAPLPDLTLIEPLIRSISPDFCNRSILSMKPYLKGLLSY